MIAQLEQGTAAIERQSLRFLLDDPVRRINFACGKVGTPDGIRTRDLRRERAMS